MSLPQFLASAGLVLDLIGAGLVFYFGLPVSLSREGHQYRILEQIDEAEKVKAAKYISLSQAGLILLVVGFAL